MVGKMDFDSEFKILDKAISSFLKDELIKDKLQLILKRPNKDWEKWLQVELEYHLEKNCRCEAKREVPAVPDMRYQTGRVGIFVDLLVRNKRFENDHYMYIELKCDGTADSLHNKMLLDAHKLQSIKQSHLNKSDYKMRSYWCIGFFSKTEHVSTYQIRNILKQCRDYKTACKVVNICVCSASPEDCECHDIGYMIF